jgi:RimJ/RimL family protein N-acetyltransferase
MLVGKVVKLRPLDEHDIPKLAEMANDEASFGGTLRHALNSPAELLRDVRKNNLLEEGRFVLAVLRAQTGELIGSAHVYPAHTLYDIPEIGVYIYPEEARRQGCGFETVALLASLLFNTRPTPKVTVVTNVRNAFLTPTLKRFGWKREAVMRRAFFYAGAHQDYAVWSLARETWHEVRDRPELDGLEAPY